MLVYTQSSFSERHNDVPSPNLFSKLLKKCGNSLLQLFAPADTSENIGKGQAKVEKYGRYNINGLIKIVFWMLISISIALIMGQLS